VSDFDEATALAGSDGRYTADLSRDWEIWGPNGGYVASIALRAAGAESRFARPASFMASFLAVAEFAPVDLSVEVLRATRVADALRVSMTQADRRILEAVVWTVDTIEGLDHDHTVRPDAPAPADLPSIDELVGDGVRPRDIHKFWHNLEERPLAWIEDWEHREPGPPVYRGWMRFRPRATFDDPYVDAARNLLLLDTMGWPAAVRAHAPPLAVIAPNIDVSVQFHRLEPASEFLFVDAIADIGAEGLIGARSRVWSESGRLLASGSEQLLCRPIPPHLVSR
jgi:acyl-CoA thioesterase-2